jgi:hypothetical protein
MTERKEGEILKSGRLDRTFERRLGSDIYMARGLSAWGKAYHYQSGISICDGNCRSTDSVDML